MTLSPQLRLALVWLVLSGVTLIAWWIGSHHPSGIAKPDPAVAMAAIAITLVKVRLIIGEFMDARHAPVLLRRLTDAWLVCFCVAMLIAYFFTG